MFSLDIGMEFSIDTCRILVMKRGRYERSEDNKAPDEQEIKEVDSENGYKYLGILKQMGSQIRKCRKNI